jgi:hypothetical protein
MHSLGRVSLAVMLLMATAVLTMGRGAHVAAEGQHRGIHYMRGAGPAAPTKPGNIPYHGGAVFAHPTVYALWWGNPSDFPPDTHDGMNHWFGVLDGSEYINLANQYLFGQQASIQFGGNLYDSSAPPTQDVPYTEIVDEVSGVLQANGMKADPNAIYAVYTSNFPNENYYCAYHVWNAVADGTMVHVMYIPNSNNQPGCWVQPPELSCNSLSNGLQAGANSTAHELMESMTDPNFDAWTDPLIGNEIGDPCNFAYKHCVHLSDGSNWQLQEIWSDRIGACAQ